MRNLLKALCLISFFSTYTFALNPSYKKVCEQVEKHKKLKPSYYDSPVVTRWVLEKIDDKFRQLKNEQDELKNIVRYIRDNGKYISFSKLWIEQKIDSYYEDALLLRSLNEDINVTSKRVTICATNCSATRRIEEQDTLAELKRLRTLILSKSPIFLSESFEKFILGDDFSEDAFKKVLLSEASDLFGELKEEEHHYHILAKSVIEDRDFPIDKVTRYLVTSVAGPDLDKREGVYEICSGIKHFEQHKEKLEKEKMIRDAAFILVPFILPAPFRVATSALRHARILRWGHQAKFLSMESLVTFNTGIYFLSSEVKDLKLKHDECRRRKYIAYLDKKEQLIESLKKCEQEFINQSLFMIAGGSIQAFEGLKIIKALRTYQKRYDETHLLYRPKNEEDFYNALSSMPATSSRFADSGYAFSKGEDNFHVINFLHRHKNNDLEVLGEQYWNHVGRTYLKRLDLSENEIADFLQSSKRMQPRTVLITNLKSPDIHLQQNNFKSGMAIITSTKKAEDLPFEKAFKGTKIKRSSDEKIAEIVRVTADNDPKQIHKLVHIAANMVDGDPKITRLYIYTSKLHSRLYRQLFGKLDIIEKNERDVLIEMTRERFLRLLSSKVNS